MDENTKRLKEIYESFSEKPTRYTIDVERGDMLPDNLAKRGEIHFNVKPPTFETLMALGLHLTAIPPEVLQNNDLTLAEAAPYMGIIIKVFCRASWGRPTPWPEWYEPFVQANCTPKELWLIFKDISEKSSTGFFLNSCQMMTVANPMTMRTDQEIDDLTHTDSEGK